LTSASIVYDGSRREQELYQFLASVAGERDQLSPEALKRRRYSVTVLQTIEQLMAI
jgi:hypothetical protein